MLTPGTRLGPYCIDALLGAGGMGEVYRAHDERLPRTVAIKVLSPETVADPARKHRLLHEARAASSLNHPHIVTLLDIAREGEREFLVLEYVDGRTLAELLPRGGFALGEALHYGTQIASALAAAHAAGIVHRDLKPGNVMVTRDRQVKVLDFGLAKFAGAARAEAMELETVQAMSTTPGMMLGTFAYMSPEQAAGAPVDHRSDIFSFGVLLYELICGRRPNPQIAPELPPGTPPALATMVGRCLRSDPARRAQSMSDIAIALEDLAADIASGRAERAVPRPSPARKRLWLGAAVVALAAMAAAGTALWRTPAAPARGGEVRLDLVTPPTSDLSSLAVSPDGRAIAYVAAAEGDRQRVWLRALDSAGGEPLAGTEGAIRPFWSPDGRSLAFFAEGRLKRFDRDAGTVLTLATVAELTSSTGTWGAGDWIVYQGGAAPETVLLRVSARGGTPERIALPEDAVAPALPSFLPDGRRYLFTAGRQERFVYVASLDDMTPRRLALSASQTLAAPPSHLLFVQRETLFVQRFDFDRLELLDQPIAVARDLAGHAAASFTGTWAFRRMAAGGGSELTWLDRAGRQLAPLGEREAIAGVNPELSPDGRRLAFERTIDGNTDVWVLEMATGQLTRLTFHPAFDGYPIWSPDGGRVAFMSRRQPGQMDLYVKVATGAGEDEALLVTPPLKMPTGWSPDGRYLVFRHLDVASATGRDLMALALDAPQSPVGVVTTAAEEREAQFSRDGRWLAYQSNESGRFEIYLQAFPAPRGKWQLSSDGGTQPRWSRDGRELFYIGLDSRLMAVRVDATGDDAPRLGRPTALFPTRIARGALPGILKQQYDVAADGRFLMSVERGDTSSAPVTVILNWAAPQPEG